MSGGARRTALIAGASGLVGQACLRALLARPEYGHVVALVRRPLGVRHDRLREVTAAFERLDRVDPASLGRVDSAFCALGTTLAKAGSPAAFRAVDHDAVASFGALAKSCGATRFALVSSVGANRASGGLYLRVKGEAEDAVAALGFPCTCVLRPSLLLGERLESRPAESIARAMAPLANLLLGGPLRRYRAVAASDVGAAMVSAVLEAPPGLHVFEYPDIVRLARTAGPSGRVAP